MKSFFLYHLTFFLARDFIIRDAIDAGGIRKMSNDECQE